MPTKLIDIRGKRFGRLVVLHRTKKHSTSGYVCWRVRCDCGKTKTVSGGNLRHGHTRSCGCGMHGCVIEMAGKTFGYLTVLKDSGKRTTSRAVLWLCLCHACGKKCLGWGTSIRQGHTRSCGCMAGGLRTHRMTGTPTYKSWSSMKNRCLNPNCNGFEYWGGRGIRISPRYLGKDGFSKFFADMGPRPDGHSLDRIDVNGNYQAGNMRWATPVQQMTNRRCSIRSVEEEIGIM